MVPDENSMEDPLCNSSFGSMVSLDYVTPDTISGGADLQGVGAFKEFVEDNEKGVANEGFAVIAMVLVSRFGFVLFFVFLFGVTAQAPLGMGFPERAASMAWLRGGTLYVDGLPFYFLDYMAIDALGLQPAVRSTSDAVLGSLYRHSQRSCQPQPLGSRREAAPCEDTRQDR